MDGEASSQTAEETSWRPWKLRLREEPGATTRVVWVGAQAV